jgi:hypothetical protein
MNKIKFPVAITLIALLSSCAPKSADIAPATDSTAVAVDYISSSAAVENKKDSTHKFVRTADLKFKVKNVIKSTYNIEDIVKRQGGFVTLTNLQSNVDYRNDTKISADSTLETTHYTVTNTITIRVPNSKLDTTLKEISRNIDFLDFRIIKADDVALQLLSNSLTIKRSGRNEARITRAIDNRGKKLNETTVAEEVLLSKQEQADNARVANMSLRDQINFSTINIEIYQRQSIKRDVVTNYDNIAEYEPGFGTQLLDSLKYGWSMLEGLLVFLVKLWGLFLFAIVIYILYVKYFKKIRKDKSKKE